MWDISEQWSYLGQMRKNDWQEETRTIADHGHHSLLNLFSPGIGNILRLTVKTNLFVLLVTCAYSEVFPAGRKDCST